MADAPAKVSGHVLTRCLEFAQTTTRFDAGVFSHLGPVVSFLWHAATVQPGPLCLPASSLHGSAQGACPLLELCLCLQISPMLAHLLFLRCNGGLEAATALPDTFGTQAFVAAAVATAVPDEFVVDVQELHDGGRQIDLGELSSSCVCAKD